MAIADLPSAAVTEQKHCVLEGILPCCQEIYKNVMQETIAAPHVITLRVRLIAEVGKLLKLTEPVLSAIEQRHVRVRQFAFLCHFLLLSSLYGSVGAQHSSCGHNRSVSAVARQPAHFRTRSAELGHWAAP